MGRSRLSGKVGAALDPCGGIQVSFELADGEEREIVFILGAGQDANDAGTWCIASGDLLPRAARSKRYGSTGTIPSAQSIWKRPTNPSTYWPTAGFCIRRSRAVFGGGAVTTSRGRLRFPRPVAGRDGAYPTQSHASCASTCSAARPASFLKEMSSIGGIRPQAGACAHTARMIFSGCHCDVPLCFDHR